MRGEGRGVRGEEGVCETEVFLANAADETWAAAGVRQKTSRPPISPRDQARGWAVSQRCAGKRGVGLEGMMETSASARRSVDRPAGAGAAVRVEKVALYGRRGVGKSHFCSALLLFTQQGRSRRP